MNDFYIHQIGNVTQLSTYNTLTSILKNKAIYSRSKMDELGIHYNGLWKEYNASGTPFDTEKYEYIDDSTHYRIISLFDPLHKWISQTIANNSDNFLWKPLGIGIAISRDVPISENKEGAEIGEVQVCEVIQKEYIQGIFLPNEKFFPDNTQQLLVSKIIDLCKTQELELPIYDYTGKQIYIPAEKENKPRK